MAEDVDGDPNDNRPLAITALQLCQASYCQLDNIDFEVSLVNPLPGYSGSWTCLNYQSDDGPNLAYVATFASGGTVKAVAVVFRGTTNEAVTDADIIDELLEDLDVLTQVALPWENDAPEAMIGTGANQTYSTVMGFEFGNDNLPDYILSLYADYAPATPPLYVIGHSLGGCIASLFAPFLATVVQAKYSQLPVIPITFAAPTAGNFEFAQYANALCPAGIRYSNTLDMVPHGWNGLGNLNVLFANCPKVAPIDAEFWKLTEGLHLVVNGKYKQTQTVVHLKGACWQPTIIGPGGVSWFAEALHQHHSSTYMKLLSGKNLPGWNTCTIEPAPDWLVDGSAT